MGIPSHVQPLQAGAASDAGETLPWSQSIAHLARSATPEPRARLVGRLLLWLCGAALLVALIRLGPLVASGVLDATSRRVLLQGLAAATLGVALLGLWGALQWQARRLAAHSLRTMANELRRGSWQEAIAGLRESRRVAPSAFGDLATQFEGVIGESERRWQARAELSADWYWETDEQGRLCWLSADAPIARPAGRALRDLLGRRHDELGFFAPPPMGWQAFHELLARRTPVREVEFEVAGLGPHGRGGWVSLSGRPRRHRDGRHAGYEGMATDITEQRAAIQRLQLSEQRHAVMAGLSADWYWVTDEQHRFPPPDAEMRRRFGQHAAAIVGRTRWEVYADALPAAHWAAHRDDLESHRPFRGLEFEVRRDDGRMLWVSLAGAPRTDEAGRFTGYHGVGRDITLRKMAEQMLLQHNRELQLAVGARTRELELANRDLDAFARQLAHELRTPIGHVLGLAELLQQRLAQRLEGSDKDLLDLQARAAHEMLATLDALLQLARSSSETIEREVVDLSALAEEVIAALPAIERPAPVQWQIQPGLTAWASPAQMRIVLHNLLGNAAKFTRRTEHPLVQLVGQADEAGHPVLHVIDNGAGFDETRAERLFQPFQRLHAQGDYPGTGIGLTIVQRIVQRHGGSISASGAPGKGACFELRLGQRDHARPR